MKIAVVADLHLPNRTDTVKETVWDWTISEIIRRQADLIVGVGDLTALGQTISARRITGKLSATGIPFLLTPGNAELRTPAESAAVLEIMTTAQVYGKVVLLDSTRGILAPESSARLREIAAGKDSGLLLFTHCPPAAWSPEDQELLTAAVRSKAVSKVIYGHKHFDLSDGYIECVRGLDPDKAIGGPPALVIFTGDDDSNWQREDIICPAAAAHLFPDEEKKRFLADVGMSGMKEPLEGLEFAAVNRLPVFEIRFAGTGDFLSPQLLAAVARWRQNGGRYLSLHMPDLKFDGENFSGMEMLTKASAAAVALGCDGVTLHVPRCFADQLNTPELIRTAAGTAAEAIRELFDNDISVGVENLHTSQEERENNRYKFGCTSGECLAFINALRELHPGKKIGLHLDIGHARNNAPFSSRETLSDWYAEAGREVVAMHIHQVRNKETGGLKNHTGFDQFYGRLISLSSLAMARRAGQIGSVPMILELRCPAQDSLEILTKELS